ncbi:CdaR family protein [Serpentinicella sp. ANB-PHB4]|uniref:CdaR family protein n=1 Tax=Serpentinicella sp. ANB-PHB4 TaxID=3074076 RepID=UPI002864FB96|nr:CdaR family protein [Serpentinicella sp. ANB-PHB4]MDR5659822.1 CdaR family protein [Serpentinicella sp. ANB-PHB4]
MTRFYKNNLTPKIIAIIFASLLWLYVMSEINPRITRDISNVPVQLINADELREQDLVVVGEEEHTIRVRLSGRRDEVQRLTRDQIFARVDLRGASAGVNNIPVDVVAEGQVDVDYTPKFIAIEIEEIVRRQKTVDVVIEGSPESGYVLGELDYSPTLVWVEGPESIVNQVQKVEARLDLTNETTNVVRSLALNPVNSAGEVVENVELDTSFVDILLPIDQIKIVDIESQITVNPAPGYEIRSVSLIPETISIRGQQDKIEDITQVTTENRVIDNVSENKEVTVPLELPDGVQAFETDEILFIILVDEIIEENYEISGEDIIIRNLGNGLTVDPDSLPQSVDIRFVGAENIIQELEVMRDYEMFVDLEGLQEGSHSTPLIVEFRGSIEDQVNEITILPESIDIVLISETDDEEENNEEEEE